MLGGYCLLPPEGLIKELNHHVCGSSSLWFQGSVAQGVRGQWLQASLAPHVCLWLRGSVAPGV